MEKGRVFFDLNRDKVELLSHVFGNIVSPNLRLMKPKLSDGHFYAHGQNPHPYLHALEMAKKDGLCPTPEEFWGSKVVEIVTRHRLPNELARSLSSYSMLSPQMFPTQELDFNDFDSLVFYRKTAWVGTASDLIRKIRNETYTKDIGLILTPNLKDEGFHDCYTCVRLG